MSSSSTFLLAGLVAIITIYFYFRNRNTPSAQRQVILSEPQNQAKPDRATEQPDQAKPDRATEQQNQAKLPSATEQQNQAAWILTDQNPPSIAPEEEERARLSGYPALDRAVEFIKRRPFAAVGVILLFFVLLVSFFHTSGPSDSGSALMLVLLIGGVGIFIYFVRRAQQKRQAESVSQQKTANMGARILTDQNQPSITPEEKEGEWLSGPAFDRAVEENRASMSGYDRAVEFIKRRPFVTAGFILLLYVLLASVLNTSNDSIQSSQSDTVPSGVDGLSVSITQSELVVTNKSGGTLDDCYFIVNDGYWKKHVSIPPQGVSIWWTEFVRGDLRFSPYLERPQRVQIICNGNSVLFGAGQ